MEHQHAWVRDNVYGVMAIWGMALAYRRRAEGEEERLRAHELEQVGSLGELDIRTLI